MASAALVDEDIEQGRKALQALGEAGVRPRAAFWRFTPESSDWRFVIALPTLRQRGWLRVYEQVQRILQRQHVELPVWRISLLSTDDPVARWARQRVEGMTGDVRSTGNMVDDTVIEDAYIYSSDTSTRSLAR